MKFVNNWRQQMALAQGAASAPLDLPDGEYVLVMSDAAGASATRWEYLRAVVAGGVGALERGQEGSDDQEWPAGSWVSCSLTAESVQALFDAVADLQARVFALESASTPGVSVQVTAGRLDADQRYALGWLVFPDNSGAVGNASPDRVTLPVAGEVVLAGIYLMVLEGMPARFLIELVGNQALSDVDSLSVEGVGTLHVDQAVIGYDHTFDRTNAAWQVDAFDWVDGGQRTVKFNFAQE